MNEVECRHRVAAAHVARLATTRADGRPHVVPICFALDDDNLVTAVDGKPKRTLDLLRLDNIRAHPPVSVLVDCYENDWSRLWWVRIDGVAAIVVDRAERAYALGLLSAKYPQYQASPPSGAVVSITVSEWSGWEAAPGK